MNYCAKECGDRIRSAIKQRGYTQEAIAVELHISLQHLKKIISGSRHCSLELLIMMSETLGVSTDYLLSGNQMDSHHTHERLLFIIEELTDISQNL